MRDVACCYSSFSVIIVVVCFLRSERWGERRRRYAWSAVVQELAPGLYAADPWAGVVFAVGTPYLASRVVKDGFLSRVRGSGGVGALFAAPEDDFDELDCVFDVFDEFSSFCCASGSICFACSSVCSDI